MNLRAISLVALPVIALLTLHGCGPSGEGMSRGNGEDPETLDPARAEGVHSFSVLTDLYEGLLALDADGNVVAGVAESWEVSDDGLRYTFHVRDDAKWSNGSAVTAGDFVNGMRRTLQPDTASAYSFLLYPVRNAEAVARGRLPVTELGVSARDKTTFIIDLHAPAPSICTRRHRICCRS
jgi:oligopeptide transport system substrate-binding protein